MPRQAGVEVDAKFDKAMIDIKLIIKLGPLIDCR